MKLIPNKYLLFSLGFTVFFSVSAIAGSDGPPAPPGPPIPPGFPIDNGVFIMIFVGIIFSFLFLKKYINSAEKA